MLSDNIVSERLILRNVTKDDSKDIWEVWSNSEKKILFQIVL